MSVTASVREMTVGLAAITAGLILGTPAGAGEGAGVPGGGPLRPLVGFGWVGLLSAAFTVASVVLAGLVRPAEGGLGAVGAVSVPAASATPVGEELPGAVP